MNKSYKKELHILINLLRHYTETKINTTLKLNISYKNKKMVNQIMQNNLTSDRNKLEEFHVVNKITCPAGEMCLFFHPYYIGITSNTLKTRLAQHKYKGAIKDHFISDQNYNNNDIDNTTFNSDAQIGNL